MTTETHLKLEQVRDRLWKCMRDRVRESFSELVVLPALFDVTKSYKTLETKIKSEVNVKKIGKQEELEQRQQNIIDGSERLVKEVENIRDRCSRTVDK